MVKPKTKIRPVLKLRDLKVLSLIESRNFTHPWDLDDFKAVSSEQDWCLLGLWVQEILKGYLCFKFKKDHVFIESILVDHDIQKQGYGKYLIQSLLEGLKTKPLLVRLAVRETNLDAQLFFKSQGFRAIKVVRDHFEDCSEDAYLMELRFEDQSSPELNISLSSEVLQDVYQDKSG